MASAYLNTHRSSIVTETPIASIFVMFATQFGCLRANTDTYIYIAWGAGWGERKRRQLFLYRHELSNVMEVRRRKVGYVNYSILFIDYIDNMPLLRGIYVPIYTCTYGCDVRSCI